MNFSSFIVLFLLTKEAYCNSCGDNSWIPYKDEKCYKLVSIDLLTREAAQNLCNNERSVSDDGNETYVPTLAEVNSEDEQKVLEEYLFVRQNIIEDVWLRATRRSGQIFYWNDLTEVKYTNWAASAPSENAGYSDCMALLAGGNRKNKDLIHNINNIVNDIDINSGKQDDISEDVEDDKVELRSSSPLRPNAGKWTDMICGKRNLVVCQKFQTWSVPKIQTTLMQIRTNLEFELSNKIPIGFIYVQIRGQKPPKELWPSFEWNDISDTYAGEFFRVKGNGAADLDVTQPADCPRLTSVKFVEVPGQVDIPTPVGESLPITSASSPTSGMIFTMSNAEVRPYNSATVIWIRTK